MCGPTAEVEKVFAGFVDRDLVPLGLVLDQLALHFLALLFELGDGFFSRQPDALVGGVPLDDFEHASFELFEVFRSKRRFPLKIVEETLFGRRADSEFGFWVELQNGHRQQMSTRVPVDLQGGGVTVRQNLQAGVTVNRMSQVD